MTTPTQGEHAQTEALRLADEWQRKTQREADRQNSAYDHYGMGNTPETVDPLGAKMAAELCRLHAQVAALTAAPSVSDGLRTLHDAILNRLSHAELLEKAHYLMELNSNQARTIGELQDLVEAATAQPAAPQGVAYAMHQRVEELIEKESELRRVVEIIALGESANPVIDAGDELVALGYWDAGAVAALRASNGQAPAGAALDVFGLKWPGEDRINLSTVFDTWEEATEYLDNRCDTPGILVVRLAAQPAPTAQAAPAAEPDKADPRKLQLQGLILALARLSCVPPMAPALEHQLERLIAFYFDNGDEEFAQKLVLLKRGAFANGRRSVLVPSAPAAGAVALPVMPAEFLRSVIALCTQRGYSPENIEAWSKDDKWVADLWRQAEQMLAAAPTPAAQADSVLEDAALLHYALADGGNQSMNWQDVYDDWSGEGYFIDALRAAYKQDAARKQGGKHD